ncbi:MAG: hypothetical protein WD315_01950 [Balneolaceae bacterium]
MEIAQSQYRTEWLAVILAGAASLILSLAVPSIDVVGWISGYLLGLLAIAVHLVMYQLFKDADWKQFLAYYYLVFFLRLLLILSLFFLVLAVTNIEQVSFTLSFIISYILHSVIDIILIHKTSTNRPT